MNLLPPRVCTFPLPLCLTKGKGGRYEIQKNRSTFKSVAVFFVGWFYKMLIFFEPLCKYKRIHPIYPILLYQKSFS